MPLFTNLVHAAVWATGANTDVRVWYQIFNVVDGNQLGAPATNPHNELLPASAGATEIGLNPWYSTGCYGGPFVVKAWITESGNSCGDVESPQFWC